MDLNYYHEHGIFIETVEKLIKTELEPFVDRWEAEGSYPDEVFTTLGRSGFLGILIPEEYGGIGGDYKMAGAWCESFGTLRALGLVIGVNMHSLVIGHALARYGSKESIEQWMPGIVSGRSIGAYAFSEPGAGSDLANIRTKAVREGDKWRLSGSKTFITNGARADFILVLARNDFKAGRGGFTTFVVDTTLPGFSVTRKLDKLGWRSSDTVEFTLDNVEVNQSDVLGQVGEGWNQAANNLEWERLMLALSSLGAAEACFKDALRYAKEREAFGRNIIDLNAVSAMLSSMYCRLKRDEAIAHHALDLLCAGKNCRAEVAAAKRLVCEDAVWIADRAIQVHGGYGYTTEFSPERWWRDLRIMTIGGGTSEIMAKVAYKELCSRNTAL